MNIAILGCGTMGLTYARNMGMMPGVRVSGVFDLNEEQASKAAALCGAAIYTNLDELLAKEKPETVAICLPTYLHKEFVVRLAPLGIHIICEKPAALSLVDARAMEEICRQHGVRLFIGHVVRFFPNYRNAWQHVQSGNIGQPKMAHFKRFGSHPAGADNWYYDRSKSGGVILDLMIHDIDYARWMFGEVKSVFASKSSPEHSGMQYAQVTLEFESDAIANLTSYWGYPGEFTTQYEISGEKGILRFDSNQVHSFELKVAASNEQGAPQGTQVPESPMVHDPYYHELQHFIHCIRTGEQPIVTSDDACRAVEIALAAENSVHTGEPVRLGGQQHE